MEFNRCLGCMEPLQAYPCPGCGFDPQRDKSAEYALPQGVILAGKYLVGKVLGQGGFGITYIGWDIALERKVAIKEFYPSGQVSRAPGSASLTWYSTEAARQTRQDGMGMFLKEARKMSKVDAIPGVVRVLDLFQENGTAYIIMDFVEGVTLKAQLQKTGPIPWSQAKEIFLPAIQTMEQVHRAGLIHRDLSPDNLMLIPDGKVKVLDLGAAKDLSVNSGLSSMQVAKSGFSPWEQYLQQGGSGPWTDVYAMAATIYYTLTGKLPPNAVDRANRDTISWQEPGLTEMPAGALKTLQKAMAVRSENRLQTMEALEKGLFEEKKAPETAVKKEKTPAEKSSEKKTRRKIVPSWLWGTAAILLLCLVFGGLLPTLNSLPATPAQSSSAPKSSQLQSGQTPSATNFDNDTAYAAQLKIWTEHVSALEDVGTLRSYLDSQDRERCRIYEDLDGIRQFVFTAEYDENGNIAAERYYDGSGALQRVYTITRTALGILTDIKSEDGSGKLCSQTTWASDSQNRILGFVQTDADGNTQMSSERTYAADGSSTETVKKGDGTVNHIAQYNADGNVISRSYYALSGKLDHKMEYIYDNKGRQVNQQQYNAAGNLEYEIRSVYEGDRLTQEIRYDHGKSYGTTDYTYGSYGELLSSYIIDKYSEKRETSLCSIRGTTLRRYTIIHGDNPYSYDSIATFDWDGMILSEASYKDDGSLYSLMDYSYDQYGNQSNFSYMSYMDDGGYSIYEYDADFNLVHETTFSKDGTKQSWTEYTYSGSTRTDKAYNADGTLDWYSEHQYDDQQHELSEKRYLADGSLDSEYAYTYSSSGTKTKIISTHYYSWNGGKLVTEYDGDWNKLSQKEYDANGNLVSSN